MRSGQQAVWVDRTPLAAGRKDKSLGCVMVTVLSGLWIIFRLKKLVASRSSVTS